MTDPYRCAPASAADAEPMAGTAPTDRAWLCVEYAGSWGRAAVADSRLPAAVRDRLETLAGVRVTLIRRHGGAVSDGVRLFAAWVGDEPWIETLLLDDVDQVADLDLAGLAAGRPPGWAPVDDLLWLVCTNGRRDRCCAEVGRPVAAALSDRWPEQTWETTHLGGHRFAGTLVALPSGVCLGRLDAASAVDACAEIGAGRFPLDHARGRAGRGPAAQVAEIAVREETGVADLDAVRLDAADPDEPAVVHGRVVGPAGEQQWRVDVLVEPGAPRRQSCADLATKATPVTRATSVVVGPGR